MIPGDLWKYNKEFNLWSSTPKSFVRAEPPVHVRQWKAGSQAVRTVLESKTGLHSTCSTLTENVQQRAGSLGISITA